MSGTTLLTLNILNILKGHAIAGGCVLAISCEYRVMCTGYKIGLNETRLGIILPKFVCASIRNTVSRREAEVASTLGTLYSTEEALNVRRFQSKYCLRH